MADTDAVQRGRYQLNDLSLYPSDAGTSLEIDSGAVGVGSFDEDNLDSQLSAELRRRWRRRVAKFGNQVFGEAPAQMPGLLESLP